MREVATTVESSIGGSQGEGGLAMAGSQALGMSYYILV